MKPRGSLHADNYIYVLTVFAVQEPWLKQPIYTIHNPIYLIITQNIPPFCQCCRLSYIQQVL
jgi:hypothetical protein